MHLLKKILLPEPELRPGIRFHQLFAFGIAADEPVKKRDDTGLIYKQIV